jgi:hypothetical protein
MKNRWSFFLYIPDIFHLIYVFLIQDFLWNKLSAPTWIFVAFLTILNIFAGI